MKDFIIPAILNNLVLTDVSGVAHRLRIIITYWLIIMLVPAVLTVPKIMTGLFIWITLIMCSITMKEVLQGVMAEKIPQR